MVEFNCRYYHIIILYSGASKTDCGINLLAGMVILQDNDAQARGMY
jgi:hypothetical protein